MNTKKILFIYFAASLIIMPCAFATEKIENEYSIKSLEKDFKYKNIEHQDFYANPNYKQKKHVKKGKHAIPQVYNIDLNSTDETLTRAGVVTFNQDLTRAKESIIKGDFKTGLEFLNRISENSPVWVLAEQAGLYEQINQTPLALKSYEKALIKGGNRTELLYSQASCFYKNNDLDKAQEVLEKVLSNSPDFMLAYYKLGNIHFQNNDYYKALRYYQKSLELNPLSLDALYNMGITLESIDKPQLALKYYKKYLNIDPKDSQVQEAIKRIQKV